MRDLFREATFRAACMPGSVGDVSISKRERKVNSITEVLRVFRSFVGEEENGTTAKPLQKKACAPQAHLCASFTALHGNAKLNRYYSTGTTKGPV